MSNIIPIGQQTSATLTELRTILSRAETARVDLRRRQDPVSAEGAVALTKVIDLLDKYRRTAR